MAVHNDPHYSKQFDSFEIIREAATTIKPEGQGINPYDEWRMSQPGFYKLEVGSTVTNFGWFGAKNRNLFWDGTFNMPIMPLADRLHKDFKHAFQAY